MLDPAILVGDELTTSVPLSIKFPALVQLDNVRFHPLSVTVAVLLMVRLDIVTAALNVGMVVADPK